MKTFIDKCKVEDDCLIVPKSAILDIADASFQGDEYDTSCLLMQIGDEFMQSNPDGNVADFLFDLAREVSKEYKESITNNWELMQEYEKSQI